MAAVRYDRDAIVDAVTVFDVCARESIELRRAGAELRGRCPLHGGNSRTAFSVTGDGRLWRCHVCDQGGSVIDLIAAIEDIPIARALAIAAELAGIQPGAPDPHELEQRRRRQRARDAARRRSEAEERARAVGEVRRAWQSSLPRHPAGEAYLREREILDALGRTPIRFSERGEIRLPLRDAYGALVNMASRWPGTPAGDRPKVLTWRGCTTLATFGTPGQIDHTRAGVIVVEGWADFLTARIRWPERAVLGVSGAGRLPAVIAQLAPRIGGRGVCFVPHDDGEGGASARAIDRAIAEAIRGGVPAHKVIVYDLAGAEDLNDLHCRERAA